MKLNERKVPETGITISTGPVPYPLKRRTPLVTMQIRGKGWAWVLFYFIISFTFIRQTHLLA